MWGIRAAQPLVSTLLEEEKKRSQVPHSIHCPCEPGGGCCEAPRGCLPSKNQSSQIFMRLGGDLPRVVGRCVTKMAGGCHPPPWSGAAWSKCAKSHQDRHPRCSYQTTWSNLNETHRGPLPDQGPPTLKMVSPYLFPLWSSVAQSKCAKSQHGATQSCPWCTILVNVGELGCLAPCLNLP